MDDEACTVITAGAIVTVTCTMFRKNMSVLFGDETVKEKHIDESKEEPEPDTEDKKEEQVSIFSFRNSAC